MNLEEAVTFTLFFNPEFPSCTASVFSRKGIILKTSAVRWSAYYKLNIRARKICAKKNPSSALNHWYGFSFP